MAGRNDLGMGMQTRYILRGNTASTIKDLIDLSLHYIGRIYKQFHLTDQFGEPKLEATISI